MTSLGQALAQQFGRSRGLLGTAAALVIHVRVPGLVLSLPVVLLVGVAGAFAAVD